MRVLGSRPRIGDDLSSRVGVAEVTYRYERESARDLKGTSESPFLTQVPETLLSESISESDTNSRPHPHGDRLLSPIHAEFVVILIEEVSVN